jgi:hypothetical protein
MAELHKAQNDKQLLMFTILHVGATFFFLVDIVGVGYSGGPRLPVSESMHALHALEASLAALKAGALHQTYYSE